MNSCLNKNFINFFIGQSLTHLGDSFLQFCTMAIAMLQIEKPGFVIILIGFFFLLPSLLISPFAGIITDKFSRKKIMIYSTMYRLLISIMFLSYAFITNDIISVKLMYIYSLLVGIGMATFYPAKMATVPNVVKATDIKPANALVSGSGSLSITAGVVFAGLFIGLYGIKNCCYLGLLMYFLAMIFILFVKIHKDVRNNEKQQKINVLHFLFIHKKTLHTMYWVIIITLIAATFYSAMMAIATDIYKVDATGLAMLKGFLGIGGCFGILFNFILGKKIRTINLVLASFIGISLLLLTSAYCTTYIRAIFWLGLVGFFAIMLQISVDIMLQKTTHDKVRGKIFGLKSVITTTVMLLGFLLVCFGMLCNISPLRIIYIVGIVCLIMAGVVIKLSHKQK